MVDWLWTCGGKSFGYRKGDNLWTLDGRHVGRFIGNEIYGPDGQYIGEMLGTNRLVTRKTRLGFCKDPFVPEPGRVVGQSHPDYSAYSMDDGYQDFPCPDAVR
ncbi:hypothetical protein P0D87_19150 [Paraburkholderia sp. RL17-368-BIF-A]|jgi:hypothetical protein|uniref:hypothetical protein n=1 Tax=Paraburkholderia sp. RL17-368-BIF-A TaxID=3031628 RepID=UPI0006BCDD22|nr:hypothetical protein AC233_30885 [Burkholderia sp. HB1]